MSVSAIDVAKWFVVNRLDTPRNTFEGNMKLQKLLYFSQLVHLAQFDEPLFSEKIIAFEHGSVVEEVRQSYYYQHDKFIEEAYSQKFDFPPQVKKTLTIVQEIFGPLDGYELSEINHTHMSWKEAYDRSRIGSYAWKEFGEISIDSLRRNEVGSIKKVIAAYESTKDELTDFIEVNGKKFFYDPTQTKLNENILKALESFNGSEPAYTFYIDESAGLVIY